MGKTWRERIAEARERGWFTQSDCTAWASLLTCPAGEVAQSYGMKVQECLTSEDPWVDLWDQGNAMWAIMGRRDFDAADRLLDAIHDRALELKRGRLDPPGEGEA